MGRARQIPIIDPETGKPLPDGVAYRGPKQYRARKLVDGARITKTFISARQASAWLKTVEVDLGRGVYVDRAEAERTALGELIERYEAEVLGEDSEKRGAEKERGHLKIVRQDPVCKIKLAALKSGDLAQFRDRMKEVEYAPATIVRRLNMIQTIIEHGRREWGINLLSNPVQMVRRPAGADRKRDRVFVTPQARPGDAATAGETQEDEPSEEDRLLAACDADGNQWLGPIVRFAILTAMRQGEIVGLLWDDIHFARCTAIVRGAKTDVTKNGDIREVPLLPEAIEILKRAWSLSGTGACVFPIDQNVLKMRYRRAVAGAGISNLRFHDLRHIATSRLAKIYTNPLELRRVTGHKDLKSLDRYFHPDAAELAKRARNAPAA